jgi:methylated-DNA-protein-cysteine methyltransferase-like protein
VRRIPKGRVATYGQIACLAGIPRQPRQVGYALAALRDDHPVPWHRVINSKGEISQRSGSGFEELQRILLESEGVVFDAKGRISLSRFRWRPKDAVAIQRLYACHLTAQWSQRDDSDLPEFALGARTAHSGRLVRHDRGEK